MPARPDIDLPPRYRDVRPLARGGMGEVLRATDTELGREVAVKVLSERYAGDETLVRRFRHEALAAARLSGHPNIVTIFDVGEGAGRPLIVMEYLPGGSLEERLRGRGPAAPAQVLDWLEDAAGALDAAHAAGVVHRDVKPGNLLLDERGRVKVADFGVASAAGLDSFTQTGTILGTAGYLSPEQARGERASAASDRYALAVVAWELLTGRRPFAAETPAAEAAAHVAAPVPSAHDANGRLPAAVDDVFRRALAKDPGARFPTSVGFVEALRGALEGGRDGWPVPTAATRVVPRPRRGLLLPAALLVLLAAAGAVAALLATRDGGSHTAATVVHTVTLPGRTVERTVTTSPPAPPTTAPPSGSGGSSGAALNDAGYRRMQAGDFAGARPLLEEAVAKLNGTGSTTEAYADYNLAYTRFALGDCTDVAALLDRSERIQGRRKEIAHLRKRVDRSC